jgi:hypothetical protein
VRKSVLRVAIRKHNTLKKQDSIHRDATSFGLSLDTSLVWKL